MKRIWIIYPYGDIPGEDFRDSRYTLFGSKLAENGYDVTWLTTNFSHITKEYREKSIVKVNDNFSVILLPVTPYKANISIGRIKYEQKYVKELKKYFKENPAPDLIITSGTGLLESFRPIWPYMKKTKVKVIFDIMDVPLLVDYMKKRHKVLSPFAVALSKVLQIKEKSFYKNVDAVSALGKNQLVYAQNKTGNRQIPSCLVYNGIDIEEFWNQETADINIDIIRDGDLVCVFAGSLGPSYDIEGIIACAKALRNEKVKFVVAGGGPQQVIVEQAANTYGNIAYLGMLPPNKLASLYKKCDIGLCTYSDYSTVDMPDKFYDYCAAGLAVINSLEGEVKDYILDNEVGFQYKAGKPEEMYEIIDNLNKNRDLLEKCKENAYNIADCFDINKQLDPFVKMVREVIGE